ncbi:hypothetical protein NLU13_0130 [Sarocladium strictum]|uniref:Uncharacterized protein n=1 Tax=Sarocladium strictum TaxID=5046 RepID=A0AA39GP86_SARSR|nr:hypothetical protein NLU13_0130 [Sarocladium strictum]
MSSAMQTVSSKPEALHHGNSATEASSILTRPDSLFSDSVSCRDGFSDITSTYTLDTASPPTTPSGGQPRLSGRGPRCPRHGSSATDTCSCLVSPDLKQEPGTGTIKSLSSIPEHRPTTIRFRSVADPLTVLPPSSWRLYNELSENETAHVQLAGELSSLRLHQGCELMPGTAKCTHRPDSDVTFASGVLRQVRSVVNKFYFCGDGSGPVPNYGMDAPTQITSRNVVVFFQKTSPADRGDHERSQKRTCGWATMWREHIRAIMARGGQVEPCPPVPVIEVREGGTFYLTFIVDTGDEAFALEETIVIGDTNSMQGLCRLRNASVYLNSWKKDVYLPWSKGITERARVVVKTEELEM